MADPAAQLAEDMKAALADPRSPVAAAKEGTVLYDLAGKPKRLPGIVAREILDAQREVLRSPEDALYLSSAAATAARNATASAESEAELHSDDLVSPELHDLVQAIGPDPLDVDPAGTAGKDPFSCPDCDRSFKTAPGLGRHRSSQHPKE